MIRIKRTILRCPICYYKEELTDKKRKKEGNLKCPECGESKAYIYTKTTSEIKGDGNEPAD